VGVCSGWMQKGATSHMWHEHNRLQNCQGRTITTKDRGWLVECPKRALQSHEQNLLILQA
jgi:hypothetical protein